MSAVLTIQTFGRKAAYPKRCLVKTGQHDGTPSEYFGSSNGQPTHSAALCLPHPGPPPMVGYQRFESLFSGPGLHLGRSTCRHQDPLSRSERRPIAFQLVFPRAGCFVRHVGRRELVGEPGQVFLFSPHETYVVSHPDGNDDCTWISLSESLLREALSAHAPELALRSELTFPRPCRPVDTTTFMRVGIIERLARNGAANDPAAVQETILQVLDPVFANAACECDGVMNATRRAHQEITEAVVKLLTLNYREPIDLHRVASAVHCSPFHLCRLFRAQTGQTLHRYLVQLRLRMAFDDALDPRQSLAELALRVGFSSHSHFTTAFSQEFGVAPSVLRRDVSRTNIDDIRRFVEVEPRSAAL